MKKSGISLISLIIVIIVIIIIAAIVIFTGLDTPSQAQLARIVQSYADYRLAIREDYTNRRLEDTFKRDNLTDAQTYYSIASGIELSGKDSTVPDTTVSALGVSIKPESLIGNECYKITSDTNIESIKTQKKFYEDTESHYLTDKGDIFILPGYPVEENGITRWYINEKLFYYSDEPFTLP